MKRWITLFLALALLLSTLSIMTVSAAGSTKNTGTRHELCTSLSDQAVAYYTGNYTWEKMSTLSGTTTNSSVTAAGSALFNSMQKLMSSTLTTTVSYKSLTSYWAKTDSELGTNDATLIYSDETSSSYNREHVWPKSHGNFYESGAGSDLHHLRPANSTINSTRNHWTFGNTKELLSSYSTKAYNGKTVLWYDSSYSQNDCLGIVEVSDDVKGDVARILLYVYVTYGNKSKNENLNLCTKTSGSGSGNSANTGDKIIYDLDTLLQWCEEDPVDTWEMSRNDCCQNIQGNRNVFIDYPEYAWLLFGREIPGMMTPSGMANNNPIDPPVKYTLTVVSEDTTRGTVSGSDYQYTAYPADGWYTSGWTLYPSDAATVKQNGDRFTVSKPTANCTLTIHFSPRTGATVNFAVPEGVSCEAETGFVGDDIKLPTPTGSPTAVSQARFLGWTTEQVDNSTEKPTYTLAGDIYRLSASETTLYALYSYVVMDGTGDTLNEFRLCTSLQDGEYVIAAPSATQMMNNTQASSYLQNDYAAITDDTVTNAKDSNVFALKAVGDAWSISDCDGKYLRSDGEKRIALDGEKTEITDADTAYLWEIGIAADGVASIYPVKSHAYGKLQFNANNPRFTTYTTAQADISLYGRTAGSRYYSTFDAEPITPCVHQWNQGVTTAATCGASGIRTYTCLLCGAVKYEEIEALGHAWDEGKVTTEPAEGVSGVRTYTCTRCGAEKTETIPPLDHEHDYTAAVVEPTCTEQGYTLHNCSCGDSYKDTFVAALGHDYQMTLVPATDTEKGYELYTCTRCDAYYTEELPQDDTDCPSEKFTDVPAYGNWAHEGIDFCVKNGLFGGTTDTTFEPETKMSRAMLVTVLWRYEGEPEGFESNFSDVNAASGSWYAKAVAWASANDIVNGVGGGKFNPNGIITREQMAAILYRYCEYKDFDTSNREDFSGFPDAGKVGSWAKDAMQWAIAEKLIGGSAVGNQTYIQPLDGATRAQVATILMRFIQGLDAE